MSNDTRSATNEIDMEALLEYASGWGNVLLKEPGKERFAAIRHRLQESVREQGAPNAAKKYLTERLITTVGKSGKLTDLPKPLRDMIGNEDAQRTFVNDLQIGYAMLVPKMSAQEARQTVAMALDVVQEAGVPPEALESLRRMPSNRVMATAGPLATLTAGALLSRVPRNPAVKQALLMAAQPMKALPPPPGMAEPVSFAGRAAPSTAIVPARGGPMVPIPPRGPGVAVSDAAGAAGEAGAAASAAGRKGIVGWLGHALRGKWIPVIGAGLAVWQVSSAVKGARKRRELGATMQITREVPAEYGGEYMIPTPGGADISSGEFLAAMKERERQAKIARFNAVTQEMDLTRDVLNTITAPNPEIEQLRAGQSGRQTQLPGRIRLGSARLPAAQQPRQTDDVMKQFDAILREAAGGA